MFGGFYFKYVYLDCVAQLIVTVLAFLSSHIFTFQPEDLSYNV